MALELVDTHCHLDYEPLSQSVEAVLARAREAGVRWCVSIGTTLKTSRANVALARRFPGEVRAAVGVHPHDAATVTDETLSAIDALAADEAVAAIGEVGLDEYRPFDSGPGLGRGALAQDVARPDAKGRPTSHRDARHRGERAKRVEGRRQWSPWLARGAPQPHPPRDVQARAFRGFLAIANRRQLPLLMHCRSAYEPLLEILRADMPPPIRGIIHCASGPPAFIREAVALGLHVSFAGNVTFPKADGLRALVALVPDDRLLLETDAPFLAPQPVRGRPNEPAYVAHTAACVARLRGVTVEALGRLTSRNAQQLFAPRGKGATIAANPPSPL